MGFQNFQSVLLNTFYVSRRLILSSSCKNYILKITLDYQALISVYHTNQRFLETQTVLQLNNLSSLKIICGKQKRGIDN